MKIRLKKGMTTGMKEIDDQHREIHALMGQFQNLNRLGKSEVRRVMKRTGNLFVHHFNTEEKVMKRCRYSRSRSHTAQHNRFKKEFNDLHAILESEGATLRFSMLAGFILGDWLSGHFSREDGHFAVFLNNFRDEVLRTV